MLLSPSHDLDTDTLQSLPYETPFFVFSKQRVIENFREFQKCFPGAFVAYAMKANSEPEILRLLNEAGAGFEVASAFELRILQRLGVSPDRIVFGTSIKPLSHIREFFAYGVKRYACDSHDELDKIAAAAPGSQVYLRARVNDEGSVFQFSQKFGTEKENLLPLFQHAKALGLIPFGVSFHVGSQQTNPQAWARALESISGTLADITQAGFRLTALNIGGGFPCPYASAPQAPALADITRHTLAQVAKLPFSPQLMLEPGRALIADTGVVVASVIGRVERPGATWLFLDTGVYDSLYEAMAFQGSTRYRITRLNPSPLEAPETSFALAGPTGDSADVINREVLLPADTNVGDKLIIHDVGAYSLVVSSPFNGFPKPKVHYL